MNPRERILLGVLLGLLIVGGCGGLFYYVFYTPYQELGDQIASEKGKLKEKQKELEKEEDDAKKILARDPRLEKWKDISLPESPVKEEVAKTRTAEDPGKHVKRMEVEYERHLADP